MASPISFGDAFLMAKLCWTLAQTFTKGRKSAPSEFREVENQLYSLSAALAALRDARKDNRAEMSIVPPQTPISHASPSGPPLSEGDAAAVAAADGEHTIDHIIRNCGETLRHLEQIVVKYGVIGDEKVGNGGGVGGARPPMFRRWGADLSRNWKKIAWTTEKGDLSALRSQMAVHTNSLNLVLAIAVNSQTTRIEGRLAETAVLIREIHDWYRDNLKEGKPIRVQSVAAAGGPAAWTAAAPGQAPDSSSSAATTPSAGPPVPQFELHLENERGLLQLICPESAWLGQQSTVPSSASSGSGLEAGSSPFVCCCSSLRASETKSHQRAVANLQLSHQTFPVRLAGSEVSWALYNMADISRNRLVSVHIKNVATTYFAELDESFIRGLALRRAEETIQTGSGNTLAYIESEGGKQDWRVLSMTSAIKPTLLHYASFREPLPPGDEDDGGGGGFNMVPATECQNLRAMPHAEILLLFRSDEEAHDSGAAADPELSETLLLLRYNTKLSFDPKAATVRLAAITCRRGSAVNDMDVVFQLTSSKAASELHEAIDTMRMELFVMSLQDARETEEVLLKIQVTQVQCEDVYIPEAEISILRDRNSTKHRMVIASRNRCTFLSQILVDDFFSSSSTRSHAPSFTSPTWLVQLEDGGGRRVYRYEKGLGSLAFRNMQSDRVFGLALHAVSGSLPLRLKARTAN